MLDSFVLNSKDYQKVEEMNNEMYNLRKYNELVSLEVIKKLENDNFDITVDQIKEYMMKFIKKNWKLILIALLVIFSLNKCTVACNRDTIINKQETEIIYKDSIIKAQSDSLKMLSIRWDENQRGQQNYQSLAIGTKQELTARIEELKNTINNLSIDNTNLKKENKQLKAHLKKYE